LRYALCTCRADRVGLKATFLPNEAGEEIDRQIMTRCLRREGLTKAARCWRGSYKFPLVILFRFTILRGGCCTVV
jgi:hypothetical protein